MGLIDQFTVKGKAYKSSKQNFLKIIVNQVHQIQQYAEEQQSDVSADSQINYIVCLLRFCLLENQEPIIKPDGSGASKLKRPELDTKLFNKKHDIFVEKLNLANDLLSLFRETDQFQVIFQYIRNGRLQQCLLALLNSGNSKIRLKALVILKNIFDIYLYLYENHPLNVSPANVDQANEAEGQ